MLLGEVVDVDVARRRLMLCDGALDYDVLVVAAGATHHYFGHDDWKAYAPGLKSIEDATEIRSRILLAFEIAERESDPKRRHAWLTFVDRRRGTDRCRAGRRAGRDRQRHPAP